MATRRLHKNREPQNRDGVVFIFLKLCGVASVSLLCHPVQLLARDPAPEAARDDRGKGEEKGCF